MERIRTERRARCSIPNTTKLLNNANSGRDEENKKDGDNKTENNLRDIPKSIDEIDKLLKELKNNEPTSDNLLYRLSIIAYEMGDLNRSIVYMERFKEDKKIRAGYSGNGKLAIADVLTQLYLLCVSLGWDFHELRKLGAEHLKERQEDFKCQGWNDIK